MSAEYLDELNNAQREAVVNTEGPALVIAGAGSGKTRVLTYRISHLLNRGVEPTSILALTFTNKAAGEMKERIIQLAEFSNARYLWMGTFHSIFARILRKESDRLGYPSSYTIYDSTDSRSLIRQIIKEMNLDEKLYKPAGVAARISSAKNNLITASAYASSAQVGESDRASRVPQIGEIYKQYAARCFRAGAMDFDDLLLNTNILFRDFPEVLNEYRSRFRYILVDEYQDTNYSQYLIVKRLSESHRNLCVVGDDAQRRDPAQLLGDDLHGRAAGHENRLACPNQGCGADGQALFLLEHRDAPRVVADVYQGRDGAGAAVQPGDEILRAQRLDIPAHRLG